MPERPRPDLDGVRDAMRARDDAPATPAQQTPPHEQETMREGVTVARMDFDGEERFQTLRRELGVTSFGINLIRLRPGQRGRIHRHRRQEEVYVVLAGTLSLATGDGKEQALEHGAVVRVAPGVRRQLTNRGSEPLVLLALGGAEPHVGRDGEAFESWEDTEGRPPQEVPMPPDVPS